MINLKYYIVILVFLWTSSYAQNLVPNPSFEDRISCPTTLAAIGNATHWYNPSFELAEYYHVCGSGNYVVPVNLRGNQNPKSGEAYAGMAFGRPSDNATSHYREYLGVKLDVDLIPCDKYYVGMHVSMADTVQYSVDNLGILLGMDSIPKASIFGDYINRTPQVNNNNGNIEEMTDWVLIGDTITADSAYQYLYIGNFYYFADCNYQLTNSSGNYPFAYYYVDSVFVIHIDEQNFSLGNDTVLCHGSEKTLDASTQNATYLWQDGSTDSTLNVTTSGMYWVEISTNCGIERDTIDITFNSPLTVANGTDTIICAGDSISLTGSGASTYIWNNGVNDGQPFSPDSTSFYTVVGTDLNGCETSDSILIVVHPNPIIDLGEDQSLVIGSSFNIIVSGSDGSYLWTSNSELSCYTCPSIIVTPLENSFYTVTVTDVNGCTANDELNINIDKKFALYLPNTFSPNEDNLNELFFPNGYQIENSGYNFSIYNRWGEVIYQTSTPYDGWDGKYKENYVPSGVYIWKLEFKDLNGLNQYKVGRVNVLR